MALVVICHGCNVRLTLGDDRAGTTLDCLKCDTTISVPVVLSPETIPEGLPPETHEVDYEADLEPPLPLDDEPEEPPVTRRKRRRNQDDDAEVGGMGRRRRPKSNIAVMWMIVGGVLAFVLLVSLVAGWPFSMRLRKLDTEEAIIDRLKDRKVVLVAERTKTYVPGITAYMLYGQRAVCVMTVYPSEQDLDGYWELIQRETGGKDTLGALDRDEIPFAYKYGRFLFQSFGDKNPAEAKAMIAEIRKALP